jgi:hypothetical protein
MGSPSIETTSGETLTRCLDLHRARRRRRREPVFDEISVLDLDLELAHVAPLGAVVARSERATGRVDREHVVSARYPYRVRKALHHHAADPCLLHVRQDVEARGLDRAVAQPRPDHVHTIAEPERPVRDVNGDRDVFASGRQHDGAAVRALRDDGSLERLRRGGRRADGDEEDREGKQGCRSHR